MNLFKVVFVAAVGVAVSSHALAGQLLVTLPGDQAKSGRATVSLDISTSGDVSGFNFFVRTGELKAGSVDLSKCVSELPKGFVGHCAQRADGIGVVAYAEGKQTLPAGIVAVGKLSLPLDASAKGTPVAIEELTLADVNGEVIRSESIVAQ